MDIGEFISGQTPEWIKSMVWLGRDPSWVRYFDGDPEEYKLENGSRPLTHTMSEINRENLIKRGIDKHPDIARLIYQTMTKGFLLIGTMDSVATMLAQGPKMFLPTAEQFESMENVDIHIPATQFRSPYEVTIIQIPQDCRRRLADRFGVDRSRTPTKVMVHYRAKRTDDEIGIVHATISFSGSRTEVMSLSKR
jgi:hypothetical protein